MALNIALILYYGWRSYKAMRNKVYILGAGCSAKFGYPVANDVVSQLEKYGKSLGDSTSRLRQCVEETVKLMQEQNVKTIDDLTMRIHAGAFDRLEGLPAAHQHREGQIWRAKLAMATLLLSREGIAKKSGLQGYHDLLHELCPGAGSWEQRLRKSRCSILTFNYDRLFEMAFLLNNGPELKGKLLYGDYYLNSGFSKIFDDEITFANQGFSFLKLHGCVGRFVDWKEGTPRYCSLYGNIQPGEEIKIHDDTFFPKFDSQPNLRLQPLLVFPHEKQHVQAGSPHFSYTNYLEPVWQKAEKLIAEADDIWIIGYSFHALDRQSIISLLLKAKKCKHIVIQNINNEADRICTEIPLKHPELSHLKWQPHSQEF